MANESREHNPGSPRPSCGLSGPRQTRPIPAYIPHVPRKLQLRLTAAPACSTAQTRRRRSNTPEEEGLGRGRGQPQPEALQHAREGGYGRPTARNGGHPGRAVSPLQNARRFSEPGGLHAERRQLGKPRFDDPFAPRRRPLFGSKVRACPDPNTRSYGPMSTLTCAPCERLPGSLTTFARLQVSAHFLPATISETSRCWEVAFSCWRRWISARTFSSVSGSPC